MQVDGLGGVMVFSLILIGKWSNEEEQRLTDAMKECTKIHKSDNAPAQYNWDEIAAMVQTRDYYHCYQKWSVHSLWLFHLNGWNQCRKIFQIASS
jgi:hypothetical protein